MIQFSFWAWNWKSLAKKMRTLFLLFQNSCWRKYQSCWVSPYKYTDRLVIDPDFCHVLVRQKVNYGWWWLYDGRAGKLTWSTSGNRTLLDLLVRLRPTICQQVVFNIYLLLNSMFEQKTVIKWTQGRASYFTGLSLQTLVVRSPQEPASNFELFFPQVDVLLHWFQLVEEAETRGVPLLSVWYPLMWYGPHIHVMEPWGCKGWLCFGFFCNFQSENLSWRQI